MDWSKENAIHNWAAAEKFDFYCEDHFLVGLIGAMWFIGWVCALLILPRLSDKYGRKRFVQVGEFLHFSIAVFIYFSTNFTSLIVCMFLFGATKACTISLVFLWTAELIPQRKHSTHGAFVNGVEMSFVFFSAIYFYFFKYWQPLFVVVIFFGFMAFLLSLLLPESPALLHSLGKKRGNS